MSLPTPKPIQRPLPLAVPSDIRNATVDAYGPGHPHVFLIVRVDGIAELQSVLAPPRDVPAIGSRIAVREHESGEWTFAGVPLR